MTLYGWDSSHYDGTLTTAILTRAKAEGISFFTHKIGEGATNTDETAGTALTAARNAGIQVIGGYYFIHSGDMIAQANRCVALADQHVPWWREFPGWFWQTDAETSSSGTPSPAQVKQFSDHLASATDRVVIVYASAGQYGNRLNGLGHHLWNANYGSNPTGGFKHIYPGDHSRGWNSYSGQTPSMLQYGSNATIAGRTTCDANAFRGTLDELLALIGADMPLTENDATLVARAAWNLQLGHAGPAAGEALQSLVSVPATLAGMVRTEAAIQATLNTLVGQSANVDTAALAAQIKAVGDSESAAVMSLQQQNAVLADQVSTLRAALAAAVPAGGENQ